MRERVEPFIAGFTDQVFSYVSEREREREKLLGMKFFPWRQCITRNGRSSLNESCIKLLSLIACGARFNTAFSVWEHNALHCIGRHQFSSSKIKSLFSKVLILHTNGEK